jgi:peroxiredoxin
VRGPHARSRKRGQRLVLAYVAHNTPVCTKQMCSYRDRPDAFAALDATIVGISAQDLDSHQGFIEKNNLTVPLLADVDKAVAKAYSALGRLGEYICHQSHTEFRKRDIERALPGISTATIRLVLNELRDSRRIELHGSGPGARWHRL